MARLRLASQRQVAETPCGPIEYATVGAGVPVLEVHGIFGGFDQGLLVARPLLGDGFRIVAPSRFGYLRTPLPAGASPASQADAYVCLLDHLGIARAAHVPLGRYTFRYPAGAAPPGPGLGARANGSERAGTWADGAAQIHHAGAVPTS
ncbi:MAG TPA: hypothetical protein VKF14_22150 [Candidatus Dormibacteraeota bacterium]|nr:hypothetical protein [Candidatus Dormibacteraeota bacterium]